MEALDPAPDGVRARLLARFTQWLDEALSEEAPLDGMAAELLSDAAGGEPAEPDLQTLFSALTVLAQEIKLQGRAFQTLGDGLTRQEQQRAAARETEASTQREPLEVLVDLRDRLRRGLSAISAHRDRLQEAPPRFALLRLLGLSDSRVPALLGATVALAQSYELSVQRLDDALRRLRVEEIACLGQSFDPHRMKAVEVLETSASPAGTVVEVYRCGYLLAGELFRPAEVKVVREPRALQADSKEGDQS